MQVNLMKSLLDGSDMIEVVHNGDYFTLAIVDKRLHVYPMNKYVAENVGLPEHMPPNTFVRLLHPRVE